MGGVPNLRKQTDDFANRAAVRILFCLNLSRRLTLRDGEIQLTGEMFAIILALYLLDGPSSTTEIARKVYMTDGAVRMQLERYLDKGGTYVWRADNGYSLTRNGRTFSRREALRANNTFNQELPSPR